jgi:CheY-like chemotaxis protein
MEPMNILIVEDEIIVAISMQSVLEDMGYGVSGIAVSGEEAVERVERDRPGLILMDITLGGEMDGITAALRIREMFDIPVVYLTGYSDEHTLRRARESTDNGVLMKPVDEFMLGRAIEDALGKREGKNTQ